MFTRYKDTKILLASMHKKELAIAKAFENRLNCEIVVAENFNTDQFGTFSGEIERRFSAYETLREKAITAANIFNYDYVISSEGSFGPHPYMFASCDSEMLLFYDRKLDLFIEDYEISCNTNFSQLKITKENYKTIAFFEWLKNVKFPSHGLIIKDISSLIIYKGITSQIELENIIDKEINKFNSLIIETDMRAMMNPTRMEQIRVLAERLSEKITKICKECSTPGFGKISTCGRLKCKICHQETNLAKYRDIKCLKCDYYEREEIYPEVEYGDPTYCNYCNP